MAATRLGAFSSCCCPVVGRAPAVVGGLGAIGGSAISISLRPRENVLEARAGVILEIVQARQLITAFGAAVAQGGGLIAIVRRLEPCRGRLVADRRHEVAVAGRPLARADAPVVRALWLSGPAAAAVERCCPRFKEQRNDCGLRDREHAEGVRRDLLV